MSTDTVMDPYHASRRAHLVRSAEVFAMTPTRYSDMVTSASTRIRRIDDAMIEAARTGQPLAKVWEKMGL